MASLQQRHWSGEVAGPSRRDRRPCAYEVYLPDQLQGRRFSLDGDVAAEVTRTETALIRLDATGNALANSEALARLLLRAESVASSRIEGLEIGGQAAAPSGCGAEARHGTARRQLQGGPGQHRCDDVGGGLGEARWRHHPGVPAGDSSTAAGRNTPQGPRRNRHERCRTGSEAATTIPARRRSCCRRRRTCPSCWTTSWGFCNDDSLPAHAQAAVAHAQFETIHPFVDGNGRAGRALIHMVLRRRGLGLRILPPVSLILATWSQDYIDGLNGTRHVGSSNSAGASAGINSWIALFASACNRSVEDAGRFEDRVRELQSGWRGRVGRIRRDSAVSLLIDALPAAPVLTTSTAAELVGRSFQATSLAMERLVEAGVLVQVSVGRRNRAFEAHELVDAFTAFERRLASPEGDTRTSTPARRVPGRPVRRRT